MHFPKTKLFVKLVVRVSTAPRLLCTVGGLKCV